MNSRAAPLRWDLFCRVIDNHGDLGVCWRLARRLVALGGAVRLWVDVPDALAWMAPADTAESPEAVGVSVLPWREPLPHETPGDVVIEAFGCDPPPGFLAAMAAQGRPPVWINLEYLSAEAYVERSHGLPSPQQSGPARGLTKWFFYPGFTPATGGLLLEAGLASARAAHDAEAWLRAHGLALPSDPSPAASETRRVSLFCYEQPALPSWLDAWSAPGAPPTALYVAPGQATRQVGDWLHQPLVAGQRVMRRALEVFAMPWLSQADYDRLLWSCDLNLVRGEDSVVRALWAARPFVWQIYPQHDNVHLRKLEAFFDLQFDGAEPALRAAWRYWNDPQAPPTASIALFTDASRALASSAADHQLTQQATPGDLGSRLYAFAQAKL